MKASAIVLSNNILLRAREDHIPISLMKLQRILYYACRDYMVRVDTSPISENFEVWKYGPVLPSVYSKFKSFGGNPITSLAKNANGEALKVNEEENPILSNVLDVAWAKYKKFSGVELSRMTHQKTSAWYKAYMQNKATIDWGDVGNDTSGNNGKGDRRGELKS